MDITTEQVIMAENERPQIGAELTMLLRVIGFVCCSSSLLALSSCKKVAQAQNLSPLPDPVELETTGDGWTELSTGVVANISEIAAGKFNKIDWKI